MSDVIETSLNNVIASLEALREDAAKVSSGEHGSKSANKRIRRAIQGVRNDLKDLRAASLSLEG